MSKRASLWFVGLLLIAALPVAGDWLRSDPGPRCALDGNPIEPAFRVRAIDHQGHSHQFCCIHCAELWLARQAQPPRAVLVTDEDSGREIAAGRAWFVRSQVVTTPTNGNRVHAFGDRRRAEDHARQARGRVLVGPDRPFCDEG